MARLVALDLAAGPGFVEALQRVWDRGDAAFPVDPRLPAAARRQVLAAMAPAAVIGDDGDEQPLSDGRPTDDGDALVMATSGTTGRPKGVVLTHRAIAAHAAAVHARLEVDPSTERWLACLPLAHMGGLGVVVRALVDGVALDVVAGFDRDQVATAPTRLGTTLVSLVATALDRLEPAAVEGFRWIVLGGSGDLASRPDHVLHTYGLTETGGGVVYEGRPLDGIEVRLNDGEIELRGPTLLRSYRDGTVPLDADGWLATGDIGRWQSDGRLAVAGRRSDLIITGGENVWPAPVEAALASHPAIAEVAVVGRDDPDWGQRVVAIVVPVTASDPPTLDQLRGHARELIPAFAAPREIVLVESLPRTALGKVAIPESWRRPTAGDGDGDTGAAS